MEATIQSTNRAINIDINVSINVDALKAIIQRMLLSIKQHCNVGVWSLPRLYRQELRMARAIARAIDRHNVISNLWIGGWTAAFIYLIFMYA